MPALNFQKQFAQAVALGQKTTTIRAVGKRKPIAVGDKLFLYTGQRTSSCKHLSDAQCTFTAEITIANDERDFILSYEIGLRDLVLAGKKPGERLADFIARRDGFEDYQAMVAWFKKMYGLPFSGRMIGWKLVAVATKPVADDTVEFQECDKCNMPDACADFGCWEKSKN
jgi:hypothetical protein